MSIKKLIKWYFVLDHYHYARWLSVHLCDLIHLHINCPDAYKAFVSGMFSFDNQVIKRFGGATAFLNRKEQSGLERWALCSSELASIIADYEKSSNTNLNANMKIQLHSRNGLR